MPSSHRRTVLGAAVRGAASAAAGTAAMDLVLYARHRARGGTGGLVRWEFSSVRGWEDAPAPAKVARLLAERLAHAQLSDSLAGPLNNVVHWSYGLGCGAAFGVLARQARGKRAAWWGPAFGTAVWLSGYAVLPLLGLYEPIWRYDAKTLAEDWSAHLVFGTVTGVAFATRINP